MPLVLIYYLEINSICILINGIILFLYSKEKRGRAESPWYKGLVWSIILYCITDMIAIVFRGKPGGGARMILWIVNTIYVTLPVFLAILWGGYTDAKTRLFFKFGKRFVIAERIVYVIALILGIVSLTTPFTGFTFILNEENIYQRQTGTYLVPVICYAMFAFYTVKMFIIEKKCESLEGRRCAQVLVIFGFPSMIFSYIQVLLYGSTMAQAGYTIAVLVIYMGLQQTQVLKDALTGLNNRREYENHIDSLIRAKRGKMMIAMIDVDDFKHINDAYGHLEGDIALQEVAGILKNTCRKCNHSNRFALYRYGGDEFILLSTDYNDDSIIDDLSMALEAAESEWNANSIKEYSIKLSMGTAFGNFENEEEFKKIISDADNRMYEIKQKRKGKKT